MYLQRLALTDFRSYAQLDLDLQPGVTTFIGSNGLGKTNLVEAVEYLSSLSSHRVSSDGPLLRFGTEKAVIRGQLMRGEQAVLLEIEINANATNRARINRANPVRARSIAGLCRVVFFAPEDLSLVKGDPAHRRRFLDDLLVSLHPHHIATRSDYEKILKQRNVLLKSAKSSGTFTSTHEATLLAWDHHMAKTGAQLLKARLDLLAALRPYFRQAYEQLTDGSKELSARYSSTLRTLESDNLSSNEPMSELEQLSVDELTECYIESFQAHRKAELDRGLSLVGPHRDEIEIFLGGAPVRGFASHGESWSTALSLRLASYYVLRDNSTSQTDPILILDDVFAELDEFRREKLAAIVATAEQVLVTAAVEADVPTKLAGRKINVTPEGLR